MECVSSVKYAGRVNNMVTEEIKSERGIRKGDPLSPYLFIIVTEWLNVKLKEMHDRGELNGVRICREALVVTHLLFADDSMFFIKADHKNAYNLKRVKQVKKLSRYLGLPVAFSHSKTEMFKFIIEKVWKRVQGWKEKILSMTGKEVLIKTVLQAIPIYAMMWFKVPDALIKRIVNIVSKYWWSNNREGMGIQWCRFGKLCDSKENGGLGFRNLTIFNKALLVKQVWRLLVCQDNLTTKLLKAKYFRESNIFDSQLGTRPSFACRSIWNVSKKTQRWISFEESMQRPAWSLESNGAFSSRSTYIGLKEEVDRAKKNDRGEQVDNMRVVSFWKTIRRLNVQPRVKNCAWRVYHDFLPSEKNLAKRGCDVQCNYQLCGNHC
ncbi:hypothetical protein QQ045_011629 [Rhodiola kirilowii]